MRTVVLSDIHGNQHALDAALAEVERLGPDRLVVLGDLLSYGPATEAILARLAEASERWPTRWVLGNHDELYDHLQKGETDYYDGLAEWVRESIGHTFDGLDVDTLRDLPWERELADEHLLFAHANPWGDWRYLNGVDAHAEAASTVVDRGFRVGVFGHTHRSRLFHMPSREGADDDHDLQRSLRWDDAASLIVNAGSIGQPRNAQRVSTFAVIDTSSEGVRARIVELDYDVQAHLEALRTLPLSDATRRRLAAYFTPPRA